jgi:hypothetical protein
MKSSMGIGGFQVLSWSIFEIPLLCLSGVQGPEPLEMVYIEHWCALHGTLLRLEDARTDIPPLD